MYVPPRFRPEADAVREFISAAEFGLLITNGDDGKAPAATHLPVMAETTPDEVIVDCHLARANPQWHELEGQEVLLVLSGPGAYVSPDWYDKPDVPTWNYLAAHLQARVEYLDEETFRRHLLSLVRRHESRREDGINPDEWESDFVTRQMRGAVGLRLHVTRLEAAFKLSQNKTDAERRQVIEGLEREGGSSAQAIAAAMRRES